MQAVKNETADRQRRHVKFGNNGAQPFAVDENEDPRAEIARLEAHIEKLSQSLERCRKVQIFSQIAIAGGALWLVGATFGFLEFDPVALMLAISAVIGGIVAFGSNNTTTKQFAAAMKQAEGSRTRLIATLDLHIVRGRNEEDRPPLLH
jgi:hypothetical protein